MSLLGWFHLTLAVAALIAGAFNLLRRKGTRSHRWAGWVFAAAMIGLNGSALAIYRLSGHFNPLHGFAIGSLATLAVGLLPVALKRPRRHWLDVHYFGIGAAYAGLVAALAAEVLVRVPLAQSFIGQGPARAGHMFQLAGIFGQLVSALGFALLLWRYDAVMAKLGRRPPASDASNGCAALSDILLLFGIIALIEGCIGQWLPAAASGAAQILAGAGTIATLILAYRRRLAPGALRWLAAYYFLILFSIVWTSAIGHFEPRDAMAFRASLQLFGLVALGVFLSGELVIAGLFATALVLAAYQLVGDWFALSLPAGTGGALLFAGWRLRQAPAMPALAQGATP